MDFKQPETGSSNEITLKRNGANLELRDNADTLLFSGPFSAVTSLTVQGAGGDDDTLTVDGANGNPIPLGGVSYDGGAGGHDSLTLEGFNNGNAITYTFLNQSSGNIDVDGSRLDFTGLEPINDNGDAMNRIFTFADGNDIIVLEDDGIPGNGITCIRTMGTAESVCFMAPSNTLTINMDNGGAGDDSLIIASVDSTFTAPIAVEGGGGSNIVDDSQVAGTLQVTVMDAAMVPLVENEALGTTIDTATTIDISKLLLNDSGGAPGATLSLVSVSPTTSSGGTATQVGSAMFYQPPVGFTGTDHINYELVDSFGAFAVGVVSVTVVAQDPQPPNTIRIAAPDGQGAVAITFDGTPNETYDIQVSTDLSNWQTIGWVTTGADGRIAFADASAGLFTVRFYRSVEMGPPPP